LTPRIDDAGLKRLAQVDIPTVLMGELNGTDLYSVDVDNRRAAQQAVEYLLGLGHRQIACISNALPNFTSASDRILGYKDALLSAGIRIDERLIRFGDFDPASGYRQMRSLLADRSFTAAFVASDNVAIGAKAALREAGLRIPENISLVGFDDIPWAQYSDPPLTTIRLPAQRLAQTSCVILMDLLQGKEPPTRRLILNTELIVRKSCREL
jgi:DNA-binding LacI/PurR family transcriptional regulator